jgi:G patch domain/KOW motif-containing protein
VWLDEVESYTSASAEEEDDDRSGSLKGWLRPHIRVRIISKSFKNGNFYNQKCIIQDIASMGECIVKLGNGDVLDGKQLRICSKM